jgi:ankyrin repeat protein
MIACHTPKEPYLLLSGFEQAAASTDKDMHASAQSRVNVLPKTATPASFLTLPINFKVLLCKYLDEPNQLVLMSTCKAERGRYTAEHRKWLVFKNHCVALLNNTDHKMLERCHLFVLSRLFDDKISEEERKEVATLAEKFLSRFPKQTIKAHIDQVLAKKPSTCNWRLIVEQLVRINLHLCITLLTFAPLAYPPIKFYPFLAEQLPFTAPDALSAVRPLKYPPLPIKLSNPRAQQFFHEIRSQDYSTALHFAVAEGYMDIVPTLLYDHDIINLQDHLGRTALMELLIQASRKGRRDSNKEQYLNTLRTLLSLGTDPNIRNFADDTALTFLTSIKGTDLDMVDALLEGGAEVNAQNKLGRTSLMYAAENNCLAVVNKLVSMGADVNLQDSIGYTALMYAAENNCLEVINKLVSAGADVNLQNRISYTALMRAAKNNRLAVVNKLVSAGADVNLQNGRGYTSLMYAAENNCLEVVNKLVSAGADVNLQDRRGYTALMYAVKQNCIAIVYDLLNAGANVNLQNNQSYTALMYAVENKNLAIVDLLLEQKVDLTLQDGRGWTVIEHAEKDDSIEIIKALAEKRVIF